MGARLLNYYETVVPLLAVAPLRRWLLAAIGAISRAVYPRLNTLQRHSCI